MEEPEIDPPRSDRRMRWRRNELLAWAAVVALSVAAFVLLVAIVDVRPLYAFLGVVIALDLPICLDLIWRAGREDDP